MLRIDRLRRCKFCGEEALEPYLSLPGAAVDVVRCGLCRMVFVSQTYQEHVGWRLFDRAVDRIGVENAFEDPQSPRLARLLEAVACDRGVRGSRVLDLRANGGGFLALARELGAEVAGIDLSVRSREHASQRHGLELSNEPITSPSWNARRFDVVCAWDLLEQVPDPRATLAGAARVLAPGGRLALTTPSLEGGFHHAALMLARVTRGRVSAPARHQYNLMRLQVFRRATIRCLLEGVGLTVASVERIADSWHRGSWYLRSARIPTLARRLLAPAADAWLALAPPRNTILAVAHRG